MSVSAPPAAPDTAPWPATSWELAEEVERAAVALGDLRAALAGDLVGRIMQVDEDRYGSAALSARAELGAALERAQAELTRAKDIAAMYAEDHRGRCR